MHRTWLLALGLVLVATAACAQSQRVLPGPRVDGSIQLPNQWSLRPAGRQIEVGDFPVNMALHPQGQYLAVLHAGYSEHEIVILHLPRQRISCRVPLEQTFYGLCFSPDGRHLYASGAEFEIVHAFEFADGLLGHRRSIRVAEEKDKFIPGGLATSSDGKTLYVCGTWGSAVGIVPVDKPEQRRSITLEPESYPYACLPDREGCRLFISLWSKASVAVLDLSSGKVEATWSTERHPTEMALSPDGKTLYVSCANSTKVSVLDAATGQPLQTLASSLYPTAPNGNTPNSLSLTPDGQVLLVANADANNLTLFDVQDRRQAKPLGFIPVGWYPTSVRFNPADRRIYVANGKGTLPKANRQGPNPFATVRTLREYIGSLYRGTVSVIDMPTPEQMIKYSEQAFQCSPLREDQGPVGARSQDNPIPAKVGDPSPIKYCVYIIKENRTYDQVFGDIPEGNGDPSLCIFPERVTPNHHKLARDYVLLDNFYVESEVSADGHEWSMGAYCTDFVEKVWPLNYRGSPLRKLTQYPAEGEKDAVARPAGGYIWDRCAEAGISYFSFGEWIANGKTPNDPGTARVKALEGHFDPWFRGYDLDYPDVKRAQRFIHVLGQWEAQGKMPQFVVIRLPNDHTAGTRVGKPTPTAMVADNDLALGMVVEALSRSRFWKEMAIFVVEDDAQNGPDHVDAHRTVALVIGPYVKRRFVDSTMYSTASMLRTMELILGLKPMSQFDAAARPMYNSFTAKPDFTPYTHLPANVDLEEKNTAMAWGAKLSEHFDLSKEDAADDLLLNEVIWRSIRGPDSPMPAPVRAAFVFPHLDD